MKNTRDIFKLLDLDLGVIELFNDPPESNGTKRFHLRAAREIGVDSVYFSGVHPTIYIKQVDRFNKSTIDDIRDIQRKIWNQGKVPFLYVNSRTEIRIYNCFVRPINPNDTSRSDSDIELFSASIKDAEKLNVLKSIFGKVSIESGGFWSEEIFSSKLNPNSRVHPALIENLRTSRTELQKLGLKLETVQDLLMRSLFMLYLEDRGATDENFYDGFLAGAKSYFDVLQNVQATYLIFEKLEDSFNGNLCPVSEFEKEQITLEHLNWIRQCFWDKIEVEGQLKLFDWRTFNFKFIPIELLSEIYEDFLHVSEGAEQTANDGAYYTPHSLVEFILNDKLPWSSVQNSNNDYNLKILDPTCGSGIFLVESFNRLVDRWVFQNGKANLSFDILVDILTQNIFGIEKNEEAIKVAAFSLYLALLDKLEPKTLWQEKRFPFLIHYRDKRQNIEQGGNLFHASSLLDGPYSQIEYDLVVGNPPYKKGSLDADTKSSLNSLGFAQELVIAFLYRVTIIAPKARIALVSTSKILTNTSGTYSRFRDYLFNKNYVESVFNLSILRKASKKFGGHLFASAVGPTCIICFQKQAPENSKDYILYCAPKSAIKTNLAEGVTIDYSDFKFLPRIECQNPNTYIWKLAMWGEERDFNLIEKLTKGVQSLEDYFECNSNVWKVGGGLHRPKDSGCYVQELSNHIFIPTNHIDRYFTDTSNLARLGSDANYRPIDNTLFEGPLVVLKEGLKEKKFCASYLHQSAVFKNSVYAINGAVDTDILKAFVAYANSKLATYIVFLTASSWGIERDRIELKEIKSLPSSIFNFSPEQTKDLALLVDAIIRLKQEAVVNEPEILKCENQIDVLMYQYLGIEEKDTWLVEDLIDYSLDLYNEGLSSQGYRSVSQSISTAYGEVLTGEINDLIGFDNDLASWFTIYDVPTTEPLNMVAIHLNGDNEPAYCEVKSSDNFLAKVLRDIEPHTYEKYGESVYFRKIIRYMDADTVYIIKPNQRRFWSKSMALKDSDEIALEILNS